ncbi:MAG: hypothetical protein ACAI37_28790 [Chthoniobacter sp.]
MSNTPSAEQDSDFPGQRAAVCLGAVLLVALFIVLALTWRDNGQRAQLETTVEYTAVGDSSYYPMPANPPAPPYPVVASLKGQPLYPVDYRRREFAADDMTRAGLDEKGGYLLYRGPEKSEKKKDADEIKRGPLYYLKISPTEYLKLRTINSDPEK